MQPKINKQNRGFTLVELSIVLVIIGLIVSSVLVGQDLIRAAEIRSTINQYNEFNSAVGTFRARFDELPGDVRGAARYGWTGDGNESGDLIVVGANSMDNASENLFFWNHLGATGANLIAGTFAAAVFGDTPDARVDTDWGVFTDANGVNNFFLGNITDLNYATTDGLSPLDASDIDRKVDDGANNTGSVQARSAGTPNTAATAAAAGTAGNCAVAGGGDYNTQIDTLECNLVLRMVF